MARVMKPPTNFKDDIDTGGEWYDGPPPTPNLYKGTVKKMLLSMAKDKEGNKEQRIMVLCEITEGKFKGAGVIKWLQLTKQGAPWLNQFLRSLTDGSDAQFKAIRDAFWDIGYETGDMDDKKRLPIVKIGKKTNPIGMATSFVTKMRDERAEISRFVAPVGGNASAGDDGDDSLDDSEDFDTEGDGMDEFSNDPTDSDDSSDDSTPPADESTAATSDDDGDPWSV